MAREAPSQLAVAVAGHGKVDREHDRPATGRFRPPHEVFGQRPVLLDVELEPPGAVGRCSHRFDGVSRHRREAVDDACARRRPGRGDLPVRVRQPLQRCGSQPDRHRYWRSQHRGRRVHPDDTREHPGPQPAPGEGRRVLPQCHLVAGAAGDEVESLGIHGGPGEGLEVVQADRILPCGSPGHGSSCRSRLHTTGLSLG